MKKWIIVFLLVQCSILTAQTLVINEVMTSNLTGIKDDDWQRNDWIEIYNNSQAAINLSGYGLSDDKSAPMKWKFPAYTLGSKSFLIIYASGKNRQTPLIHTNFALKSSGEILLLSNPQGNVIDSVRIPELKNDISYGRKPDASGPWYYFMAATPGRPDTSKNYTGFSAPPVFSLKGGIFTGSCSVALSCPTPGVSIYYTTNGAEPTTGGSKYTGALVVSKTATVRAKAFLDGAIPDRAVSESYIINPPAFSLPVVTLSTHPDNLWSDSTGIYVMGKNASPAHPYFGANFWQPWEKPFNFQFIDTDKKQKYNADCGLEIFGTYSRANPQKSFDLHAREEYGVKDFNYSFFRGNPTYLFSALVLRNGGNDYYGTLLRDRLTCVVMEGLGIGAQSSRFVHSYLNGEYWGIYCLREKLNEHFIASRYNVNPDSIDLIENENAVIGSNQDYKTMIKFLNANSPSTEAVYGVMKDWIDVNNFKNYQIAQIFINNTDWPGNNVKCWREQKNDAKWRWIIYDTDFGFGFNLATNSPNDYMFNTLDFATAANGPNWPNPPWSTFLLRKMLESREFKNDFIVSFIHLLNTRFNPDSLVKTFSLLKNELQNDIKVHNNRWKDISNWEYNCSVIKLFLERRSYFLRDIVLEKFSLPVMHELTIDISDPAGGGISLQEYPISGFPFKAPYPAKTSIRLSARPNPGYRFAGWTGDVIKDSAAITVNLSGALSLRAVFLPVQNTVKENIVINEINYKSSSAFDAGDWVEIYNHGKDTVNLNNWQFRDSDDTHIFNLPAVVMKPGDYLVLVNDSALFSVRFPDVKNLAGTFVNGLSSKGDAVRIYNSSGRLVDSVRYGVDSEWTAKPNGSGATLSLINPDLDNTLPGSWKASAGNGTPGRINDVYTSAEKNSGHTLPEEYSLEQNFPNPFNPSTLIRFGIPKTGRIKLSVFDMLGREAAVLQNEEKPAGVYTLRFDAAGYRLGSGVYFYCLEADGFRTAKKLIYVK